MCKVCVVNKYALYLYQQKQIKLEIMTTQMANFNKINPLVKIVKKDGFTLEIRERGYFVMLSNGTITKKGIRMNEEMKAYFGV